MFSLLIRHYFNRFYLALLIYIYLIYVASLIPIALVLLRYYTFYLTFCFSRLLKIVLSVSPLIFIQGVPGGMCQTSGECSLS